MFKFVVDKREEYKGMKKRVSAFFMAIVMLFVFLPVQTVSIKAEGSEEQKGSKSVDIEFTIKGSDGKGIPNASLICTLKVNSDTFCNEQTIENVVTRNDGTGVITVTESPVIDAINDDNTVEIEYAVYADGYSQVKTSVEYQISNGNLELKAYKKYSVKVVSEYNEAFGTVEIDDEKKIVN